MRQTHLTRRKLLTGLGATGVASVTGLSMVTKPARGYTESTTLARVEGGALVADWRETYNGAVLEDTRVSPSERGAALSLQNVLPGDNGVLSIRLRHVSEADSDTQPPALDPRLTLSLSETAENGRSEPERVVGDRTAETGELQDLVDVAVWYDTGLAAVDTFGADNGVRDIGERLVTAEATGTLAEVAPAIEGTSLTGGDCLGVGESVSISFGWTFDDGAGVNVAQGDSVVFDCLFDAHQCGGSS